MRYNKIDFKKLDLFSFKRSISFKNTDNENFILKCLDNIFSEEGEKNLKSKKKNRRKLYL